MEIIFKGARQEIPEALVSVGYTEAQAQAICCEWLEPLEAKYKAMFLSMVYNGQVAVGSPLGMKLLLTSRGW